MTLVRERRRPLDRRHIVEKLDQPCVARAVAMRGNDAGREAEAPETALPEVQASPVPKLRPAARAPAELPRQSSFVAAAAVALFDLMERA